MPPAGLNIRPYEAGPTPAGPAATIEPLQQSLDEHPVIAVGEQLIEEKLQDRNWDPKTCRQARHTFHLVAKVLQEAGVASIAGLRQSHCKAFKDLLRAVSPDYGKSSADRHRTTAELRLEGQKWSKRKAEKLAKAKGNQVGEVKPEDVKPGLQGVTINRHLGFLGNLLDYVKASGGPVDRDIDLTILRVKDKKDRARNKTATFSAADMEAVFRLPCFVGCESWKKPMRAGTDVFHRALYFAPILLYYSGARRDEICGLVVEELLAEPMPYIKLQHNRTRRVKNSQSARDVALHPELERLGFLEYVRSVKELGYDLCFPDLWSPTSRSPLGDRLYDEFIGGLREAVPESQERRKVIHSLRKTLNNDLKQARVAVEVRADILGHGGESETDERYVDPIALRLMLEDIMKTPNVTAHLPRLPIRLIPWVANRERPPFSRPSRSKRESWS
jgi:integrase